jgi:hypothetical protein
LRWLLGAGEVRPAPEQQDLVLSEPEAFVTLQRQSRQRGKSMKEIAEAMVLSDDVKRTPGKPELVKSAAPSHSPLENRKTILCARMEGVHSARRMRNRALLTHGGLGFGRVDFDAALEMGAIFDADARGGNVADDRAFALDVDAVAGVEVADDFAKHDHLAGMNFGIEHGGGTDGELMAVQRDGAVHLSVNLQVFRAGELTLDMQARTQAS